MAVGVPIATEAYVFGALGVVRDEGADCLARCLADMPDKQAPALIDIEFVGQRTG